jgi:hypothetical protein
MLFKYTINLELEVEFEAPLLGTDTTKQKRKHADSIAKKALQEIISLGPTEVTLKREVDYENLKGIIKGSKHLGKSDKNKY